MEVYTVSYQWKICYILICLISMIFSSIIPLIYYKSQRSRHHPASLIVLICISEMITSYHLLIFAVDIDQFIQYFGVEKQWNWWNWRFSDENTQITDVYFCKVNTFTFIYTLLFELLYECVLCIDLLITLKMPFISGTKRMPYYSAIVFSIAVVLFSSIDKEFDEQCDIQDEDEQPVLMISYPQIFSTQILFNLIGFMTIFMSLREIIKNKKNKSELQNAKIAYLIQHVLLIVVLSIIIAFPLINYFLQNSNKSKKNSQPEYPLTNNITFCVLLSQGFFLGLIRLWDPFFRMRTKVLIMEFMGCSSSQKEQVLKMEVDDDPELELWNFTLAALVAKAQNQEVVSQILEGVIAIIKMQAYDPQRNLFNTETKVLDKWSSEKRSQIFKPDFFYTRNDSGDITSRQSFIETFDLTDLTMIEYAPQLFQLLRAQDQLYNQDIVDSLNPKSNYKQIENAQESMGKSGSFFFFSNDGSFILKTITSDELSMLVKLFLIPYTRHIQNNSESTLSRIYGVYEVIIDGVSPIKLVLLENTLQGIKRLGSVQRIYDLKGSLTNRYVEQEEQDFYGSIMINKPLMSSPGPRLMKDRNFLESEDIFLELDKLVRESIIDQLKKDTDFLLKMNIMDYSLLLAIGSQNNSFQIQSSLLDLDDLKPKIYTKQIVSQQWRMMYDINGSIMSVSLIDYLQRYNWLKRLENKYKIYVKQREEFQISCILPRGYQNRFLSFINQIISIVNDR